MAASDDTADEGLIRCHTSPASLESLTHGPPKTSRRQLVWLVFLFVVLDTSKSLAVSWAAVHGHMCAPLVIFTKNMLSIGFGMTLAALVDGEKGLRQCLDMGRSLKVFPIASCFCAAQIFSLQALRAFDAGSLKVIAQLNLPTTAFLSSLLLGRRYSTGQWFAIALLFIATVAFLQVRMLFFHPREMGDPWLTERAPNKVSAMFYFLSGIAISCSASVFAEKFLKTRYEIPFYIQKTNLMFGELLPACVMVHASLGQSDCQGCSWEQIQDWRQLPVILLWVAHGWTASFLVKRCSVLGKNVSHILSTLVTYFLPLIFITGGPDPLFPVTLSACLVLAAVLVFATVPQASEHGRSRKGNGGGFWRRSKHAAPPPPAAVSPAMSRSTSEVVLHHSKRDKKGDINGHMPIHAGAGLAVPPTPAAAAVGLARHTSLPTPAPDLTRPLVAVPPPETEEAQRKRRLSSVGLLTLSFILLDATKPLLMSWAQQRKTSANRFNHTTFVLTQTALSLAIGLILALRPTATLSPPRISMHPDWWQRVKRCTDLYSVMERMPVSFCLCLSKLFLVMALERLDAGTVRVFSQSSLPLVALSTAIFFSQRYSLQQWCSLLAVSLALGTFYHVKNEVALFHVLQSEHAVVLASHTRIGPLGLLLILGSITFNCLGALLVEKFLKGHRGALHEQKSQLLLGEVIVNTALLLVTPGQMHEVWVRGFFAGWDRRAFICMMVWIPAGWTTTMIVKRCSNVLKTVAQATSSVLTYVFSVFPVTLVGPPLTPEPLSSPVVLLAITVMLSALTFGSGRPHKGSSDSAAAASSSARRIAAREKELSGVDSWAVDGGYSHAKKADLKPSAIPR